MKIALEFNQAMQSQKHVKAITGQQILFYLKRNSNSLSISRKESLTWKSLEETRWKTTEEVNKKWLLPPC